MMRTVSHCLLVTLALSDGAHNKIMEAHYQ